MAHLDVMRRSEDGVLLQITELHLNPTDVVDLTEVEGEGYLLVLGPSQEAIEAKAAAEPEPVVEETVEETVEAKPAPKPRKRTAAKKKS